MQVICTSLQTDNHANTESLKFFTGWMLFLLPDQQHQSTEGLGSEDKVETNGRMEEWMDGGNHITCRINAVGRNSSLFTVVK